MNNLEIYQNQMLFIYLLYLCNIKLDSYVSYRLSSTTRKTRHENNANCYRQIGSIGPDAHLKCPAVTFLETVFIQTATLL